jgi:hypothetical protein
MDLNLRKFLSTSILLTGIAGTASAGTVYDVVAGFSNASNPNGLWSYDYTANSTGTGGTAFSNTGSFNGQPAWVQAPSGVPTTSLSITGNLSVSAINAGAATVPGDTLNLNPELSNVEILFTAPAAGSYIFAGTFLDDDANVVTHPVDLFDNGTNIFAGTISTSQTSDAFNVTRTLSAGEVVVFFVGSAASSMNNDFNTGLTATVTQNPPPSVPEPAAMSLLAAGFAGMAAVAGWKRRQAPDKRR